MSETSVRQQLVSQVADAVSRKTDAQIKEAISQALGRSDWSLGDLIGRLEAVQYGWGLKTYYLDGRLICEVFPVKTMFDDHGGVTCTRDFRTLAGVPANRLAADSNSNKTYKSFPWMKP
jgi:hypothetical protein